MPSPLSLPRPVGSTQVLRYRLQIDPGQAAAVYPKTNATFAPDSGSFEPSVFTQWARFALFNPDFVAFDVRRRFPAFVYDDSQFASQSPHKPIACLPSSSPGINDTDLSLNHYTWAQNVLIHYNKIDKNVLIADTGIARDNSPGNGALILLDTLESGLGQNTGLPVVAIRFEVSDGGQQGPQPFDVDLEIEIRKSSIR